MPWETETRKLVSAMKETAHNTGNVDTIATSLAHVTDKIPVHLFIPKKTSLQKPQQTSPQKTTQHSMPNTRHCDVPSELADFLLHDTGKKKIKSEISFLAAFFTRLDGIIRYFVVSRWYFQTLL